MTGGDRYERVDQVRLYGVPNTMEWPVRRKSFFGLLTARVQVLFLVRATCRIQGPNAIR